MPIPPEVELFDRFAFEVGECAEVDRPDVEFFDAAGQSQLLELAVLHGMAECALVEEIPGLDVLQVSFLPFNDDGAVLEDVDPVPIYRCSIRHKNLRERGVRADGWKQVYHSAVPGGKSVQLAGAIALRIPQPF
jgi:hypothetical protein